ncbi:MAG: DNA primase [Bacteroidales bacterium]|nr:DNA primase [Bacteroidales bacterium]
MITQKCIDEIKLAARIEEVVGDFVQLKKSGASYKGMCPFHNDHDPSLHVTPRLGIYHCFVCGASGDAIKFLRENQQMSYTEALRYLAEKYHIEVEEEKRELTPEQEAAKSEREALLKVNEYAEKFFIDQLFNTEEGQNIGMTYLRDKRGFRPETIKKFKLGYCPDSWETFSTQATNDGYNPEYLITLGLCRRSEKTGRLFDFYKGRVIFPILNTIGSTIGFGGRVMSSDVKGPKYYNSPENPIYHKSDVLYGFYQAKRAMRTQNNVYLVEGYTDVISMSEAGVENVVASSGTALTEGQIKLVKSQTDNITVLYDGDRAGIKASLRGINMLVAAGLHVKAVLLPDGEDPDSFAKGHRDSELYDYLTQNAVSVIQFKADVLMQDAGDDPLKRAEAVKDIIATIAEVRDEIERAFYVKECAELLHLSEESVNVSLRQAVWKRINTRPADLPQSGQPQPQALSNLPPVVEVPQPQSPAVDPIQNVELDVVRLLLKYGMLETNVETEAEDGTRKVKAVRIDQYVFNEFSQDEILFENPLYQRFYKEYARLAQEKPTQEELLQAFAHHEDSEIQELVIPILSEEEPPFSEAWLKRFDVDTRKPDTDIENLNQALTGCINLYKLRLIEKQKKLLTKELEEKHTEKEEREIMERLVQLNEMYRKLGELQRAVIVP